MTRTDLVSETALGGRIASSPWRGSRELDDEVCRCPACSWDPDADSCEPLDDYARFDQPELVEPDEDEDGGFG
jgi:hypothetical protein